MSKLSLLIRDPDTETLQSVITGIYPFAILTRYVSDENIVPELVILFVDTDHPLS